MRADGWMDLSFFSALAGSFRHESRLDDANAQQQQQQQVANKRQRQSALGFRWMEAERVCDEFVCVPQSGLGNEVNLG